MVSPETNADMHVFETNKSILSRMHGGNYLLQVSSRVVALICASRLHDASYLQSRQIAFARSSCNPRQ